MAVALGVLVSGSGTILEAFLSAGLVPRVVASDRPCRGLEVARAAGVEALLVPRSAYGGFGDGFERERYSVELAAALAERGVGLVAMAGFGTVLAPSFFGAFPGRVLNTHPSLLPAFKGWHAVAATLAAGVAETGCTVHVATEALDDGPILAQRRVPVDEGDDEAHLHERIKGVERALYPEVVARALSLLEAGREPADLAAEREPA
ncbi:MAG TPA: phosphoribosylglycinamide formyltransferase [Acidimicrobiales bacterium]|nr:MAG: phosphoribosylglycinamide formyltransferase [Actinobacteria bacterium 21-73-9]HQU26946.1 phosphoribosylglycinamide formyltransferase [Acidimicrobiales bacterium]